MPSWRKRLRRIDIPTDQTNAWSSFGCVSLLAVWTVGSAVLAISLGRGWSLAKHGLTEPLGNLERSLFETLGEPER